MKLYGILCIAVAVIMLLAPLAALSKGVPDTLTVGEPSSDGEITPQKTGNDIDDTISVFMSADEKTEKLDMRDYIIGAVSAEMPASYDIEALKAQALAAVTFAEYSKKNNRDGLSDADISDDSSRHQGYITTKEMREKWGDAYDTYYEKIEEAVDAVIDKVITYDGEPIMAAYHAISSGQTESAENMWGNDIAYLKSVPSEGDMNSPRYSSQIILTPEELKKALKGVKGADFDGDEEDWIKITSVTDSGTVMEVNVGGKSMTGSELRAILSMRSPVFTADYEDGEFVFNVSGYGHGVGMSQYGADCYAKQGMTYEEIIEHYYPGTEISARN